jgi:hypothetical protein
LGGSAFWGLPGLLCYNLAEHNGLWIKMNEKLGRQLEFLFLILIIILGGWLRFAPTLLSGEVINDGGMFYSMTQAVRKNGYALPYTITYNDLDVPFAYPPGPFYLAALLADVFRSDLIEWFRWLPAAFSTLSILAFYLLARTLLKPASTATLATAAFAFLPRAYTWFVMGGGISRGLGQLFLLLTLWGTYQAFARKRAKHLLLTCFTGALVALSHPGQLLHMVVLCACLWLYLDWKDLSRALVIALGVLLLSAPWWLTVLLRHGISPFLSASQTGGISGLFWLPLVFPTFAEEYFLSVFTILGLLGLVIQLQRREYLLLIFLIVPFFIDPRSASSVAVVSLAMLSGIGLNDLILPGIAVLSGRGDSSREEVARRDWVPLVLKHRALQGLLAYLFFVSLLGAYAYDQPLSRTVLPEGSRAAMQWIRNNSPPQSRFLLLTGGRDPFGDPVQEWFPVYAERTSVNTLQGKEWSLGGDFLDYARELGALQVCLNAGPDCVTRQTTYLGIGFDYLFLQKTPIAAEAAGTRNPGLLMYLLSQSPMYTQVYENNEVILFSVKGPSE